MRSSPAALARHPATPPVLAALLGLGWYVWIGGGHTLWPTHVDWTMTSDWATHELGFLFYRLEPLWRFPLGQTTGLQYPVGTSVGYTDSMPWLALLGRVFTWALPVNFQYIGPWLGLAFALQAFFGARLVSLVSPSRLAQVAGGVLFAINPVLLLRLGHDSLCGHWVLLALLHLNLRPLPDDGARARALWSAFGLAVFSAGIHPYLAVMVLALCGALALRFLLEGPSARWRGLAVAMVAGSAVVARGVFQLFGYFSGEVEQAGWGFGVFSADLSTFINPLEWSRWVGPRPIGTYQYEGFAYLGLGVLGLAAVAAVLLLAKPRVARTLPWRRALPLVVVAAGLALFAAASVLTFDGRQVADLRDLYKPFEQAVAPFRSSGRFVWPLYYVLVAAAVLLVARVVGPLHALAAPALLVAALGVQVAELKTDAATRQLKEAVFAPPTATAWNAVGGEYRHLALVPPQVKEVCGAFDSAHVHRFGWLAYRLGLTFNSAYLARVNAARSRTACEAQLRQVQEGRLEADTIYVADPQARGHFLRFGATCGLLDGQLVCVAGDAPAGFREALATTR